MPGGLARCKDACARLVTRDSTGTGYLISATHIATCHHVVGGLESEASIRVFLGPANVELQAKVLASDARSDCAVLLLDRPVSTVEPLLLAKPFQGKAIWDGYGFPALAKGAGLPLTGQLLDPDGRDPDGNHVLTLYSDMVAAGQASPAHGFSGAPILIDGVVVGHIKRQIGDPDDRRRAAYGIVWACPASAVRALIDLPSVPVSTPDVPTIAPPPIDKGHYHVFLSYRSTDVVRARDLAGRLEGAGLKVFLDQKELQPGDSLVVSSRDALTKSRAGVVLVSHGWLVSPWCQQEWRVLESRVRTDPGFLLVPIRLDDSELPSFLTEHEGLDFREDGNLRREMDRLVLDLLGVPKPVQDSPAADIHDAETRAIDEFVQGIRGAVEEHQVWRVWEMWRDSGLTDVRPALVAAERLIGQNMPREALEALEPAGEGLRARQLRAFAMAKAGNIDDAIMRLESLRANGELDSETGGLLAGRYKQRWKETGDRAALQRAYEIYKETFERTGDTYNGINAATLALFCGDSAIVHDFARKVLASLRDKPESELDHWGCATVGEAYLLSNELDQARKWYGKAVANAVGLHQDIAIMRRQARWILEESRETGDALDEVFPVPRILAFSGHMVDQDGRDPQRFPQGKIGEVRLAIRARLQTIGYVHGFSTAAKGSDILFLEELFDRGGTATVVLPFPEEHFLIVSSDEKWTMRWNEVKDKAGGRLHLDILSRDIPEAAALGTIFAASNKRVLELARDYAKRLDEDANLVPLMVWDGKPGDGPGGTADAVRLWREEGFEPQIIDIERV